MSRARFGGFHGIVFDAFGTLFDVSAIMWHCRDYTDYPEQFSQLWRTKQLEYSVLRTVMDRYSDFGEITSDALEYTCGTFGVTLQAADRRRLMRAWSELPPFPEVVPALQRLRAAGQPMAILSNGTRAMLDPLVEHAGLGGTFAAVLTSEQVQAFKPDLALYQLVTTQFYVRMNELLFVTANGFDVAGAKAAGFTVCRVDRTGSMLDPLGFEPDMVVRDLTGLADVLTSD